MTNVSMLPDPLLSRKLREEANFVPSERVGPILELVKIPKRPESFPAVELRDLNSRNSRARCK